MIFAVLQTLRSIRNWRNHLPNSSLCIGASGQANRREAPAGDIMDHIAAFFDARIAALTGAGIKRNRLVLDPGMGFFLGAAPETSLSVLARFDELRLRFDLPVLLSVSRESLSARAHRPWSGGCRGRDTRCRACRRRRWKLTSSTHEPRPSRRAGGIGGAERNHKNSLMPPFGIFLCASSEN